MRSPVVELLADLAAVLEKLDTPWFLFGAQAALLHGAARLTADVDVTVKLPEGVSVAALTHELERREFRRRTMDPAFTERTRVIPLVHLTTQLPIDVVLAGSGIEDTFFERVHERDIDGVRVKLASPEDIVIMKVLAGRTKDLDDVVAVAAAYGEKLDVAYVEGVLAELESALSQSDLLPKFGEALARARRADPKP